MRDTACACLRKACANAAACRAAAKPDSACATASRVSGANQGARRELLRNTAARTVCLSDKRRRWEGADVGRSGGKLVRRSTTASVQGVRPKSEDAGFYGPPETEVNPWNPRYRKNISGARALKDSPPKSRARTFQRRRECFPADAQAQRRGWLARVETTLARRRDVRAMHASFCAIFTCAAANDATTIRRNSTKESIRGHMPQLQFDAGSSRPSHREIAVQACPPPLARIRRVSALPSGPAIAGSSVARSVKFQAPIAGRTARARDPSRRPASPPDRTGATSWSFNRSRSDSSDTCTSLAIARSARRRSRCSARPHRASISRRSGASAPRCRKRIASLASPVHSISQTNQSMRLA